MNKEYISCSFTFSEMLAIDLNMADIFQPVHLLSFLMQIIDPVHKSDTCAATSNVRFLIAAPIDCALQISDTCLSIESSLLNGAASVYTIKVSTGACCMIRSVCSAPPSIDGLLSGIKGSFFSTDSLFHCLTASAFALSVATTNFQSWKFFEDGASIPG